LANLRDNTFDLRNTSGTGVDIRGPQPRTQQLVSAENVQRQIAVVVVVAMEEARFLLPVQRGVGGVHIQNDGPRRFSMGLQYSLFVRVLPRFAAISVAIFLRRRLKQRDQQFVDRFRCVADLVVALGSR
jgi:hypothetical protein